MKTGAERSVVDHRNKCHDLRVQTHFWLHAYEPDLSPRDLDAVRRTMIKGSAFLRAKPFVLVLAFALLVWAYSPWSLPAAKMKKTIGLLLSWARMLFAIQMVQRRLLPRTRVPNLVAALLQHGFCGCCAYDLRAAEAEPTDGCKVCPECGAAWRG
jgi:hypothetical protein